MKSFSRTLTTCVASAALLVASAGLAQAAEPQVGHHDSSTVEGALRTLAQSPEVLSQVTWEGADTALSAATGLVDGSRALVDRLETDGLVEGTAPSFGAEILTETGSADVLADADGALISVVSADAEGQRSEVSLAVKGDGVESRDGATVTISQEYGSMVAQATEAGGVQALAVIDNEDFSGSFSFDLTSDGGTWQAQEDGAVALLDESGSLKGLLQQPWAVDADGKYLETHFARDGDTFTQVVDTEGAAFPIVADPSFLWWAGTAASCAASVATLVVPATMALKASKIAVNLAKLADKAPKVAAAIKTLGGASKAAIALVKNMINSMKSWVITKGKAAGGVVGTAIRKLGGQLPSFSLTAKQKAAVSALGSFTFVQILDLLGFGSCVSLIREVQKL